ncbi:MAG: GNAT family N-acetyltransferase [Fibrobacter sp.]|nr:GNAT family N-acetyltransferase [Fibrobacter sp.]
MSNRLQIEPVNENTFKTIDVRGCFSSPKVNDFQSLFDCSWNFDRLVLKSSEGNRELLNLQKSGSFNAFACIDAENESPIAFFTLAASTLCVPAQYRKGKDPASWDSFPSIQIDYLFVDMDLRKCGVGSFILNWIKKQSLDRRFQFEAFRFIYLNSIKTEQAIRFYKKNDFVFADCDDELDIEQALNDGTFCDDKEMVVPMFFDLNSLKL